MVSMFLRDHQALSSTLTSLGMLQPQAFRSLKSVETLDSVSNYYLLMVSFSIQMQHLIY